VITKLVKTINEIKPIVLHIISDGENKDTLIERVKSSGVTVEYYGKINNLEEKQ
jgi:hypothetical protein